VRCLSARERKLCFGRSTWGDFTEDQRRGNSDNKKTGFPTLRERPLAWVEFDLFDRRYFVVGAGGGVDGVLVLPAGGKLLSRNWSRMPALAGLVAGHCRSAAF